MILENGIVRTLDPSLPTARALAIAGAHIAGGVGVHESALASPETVDLGGRCVLPAFTDSHVHFPTWSLNQRQVQLDGCASLGETLARIREAKVAPGRWLRGYGWRSGDWSTPVEPTKEALDEVTGDTPAIFFSKDYHSAWLNSAALAVGRRRPRCRRRRRRARRARRADGRPARGVGLDASATVTSTRRRTSGSRRRAPGSSSQTRAASARSTTRTAGSALRGSSSGCATRGISRCASGARSRTGCSTTLRRSRC